MQKVKRPKFVDQRWVGKKEEFLKLFAQKMGDLKIYFGVVNNATIFIVRDAVSYAQEHNNDYRIKKKIKFIWSWLSMMEYRLKTDPMGWFKPESQHEDIRKTMKDDVTDSNLYEYWVQSAGKSYEMLNKAAGVIKHKYELILKGWGCEHHKTIAHLATAQWLLEDQHLMFEGCVNVLTHTLDIKKECTKDYLSAFNLEGLNKAVESLIYAIYPEAMTRTCNEEELHNLQLAWESVEKVLGDPDFIWNGCIEAAAEDEDVFKTPGFAKKRKKAIEKNKSNFVQAYYDERNEL